MCERFAIRSDVNRRVLLPRFFTELNALNFSYRILLFQSRLKASPRDNGHRFNIDHDLGQRIRTRLRNLRSGPLT